MNRWTDTMRAIARVQDNWIDTSGTGSDVRERLFGAEARRPPTLRSRRLAWVGATCGALGIAAGMMLFWKPADSTLSFVIEGAADRAELGKWVSAPPTGTLPLAFSDGSHIVLQHSAQARVTELSRNGAHVVLERGRLTASVVHRQLAQWEVQAGPFSVMVSGTRFNLEWAPENSTLVLEMTEGLVNVVGPGIAGTHPVKAGQTLRVVAEQRGWHIESSEIGQTPSGNDAGSAEASSTSVVVQDGPLNDAAAVSAVKDSGSAKPDWQELAATGEYGSALAAARKYGVQRICTSGSAGELAKLARVARLAGDAETARSALRSMRERFAGSPEAAMATFDLGRLAFDTSGRFLEAAHWFREYLREFPHGKLAREATGRLIESLERGGDHMGAREVANDYLLKYPTGPHAGLSHRLLNR